MITSVINFGFLGSVKSPKHYVILEEFDDGVIFKGTQLLISSAWKNCAVRKNINIYIYDNKLFKKGISSGCENAFNSVKSISLTWKNLFVVDGTGNCHVWKTNKLKEYPDKVNCSDRFARVSSNDTLTALCTEDGVSGLLKFGDHIIFEPFNLGAKIKSVSCGKEHVLLLSNIGIVFTYGSGSRGQLGNGSLQYFNQPQILENLNGLIVKHISAGGWHSLAISDIGDIYSWGWNNYGQIGLPCSNAHETFQLKSDSDLSSFNGYVDLNTADYSNMQSIPILIDLGEDININKSSCGSLHSAFITDDGCLYTFGCNKYFQLGFNDEINRFEPENVKIKDLLNLFVCDVECGWWNTIISCIPLI